MGGFLFFLGWLIASILVAKYASSKGLSGSLYFFLCLILSPILVLLFALVVSPDLKELERRQLADKQHKKCPFCAEVVKSEALVCKHCGKEIPEAPATPQPQPFPPTKKPTEGDSRAFVMLIVLMVVGSIITLALKFR